MAKKDRDDDSDEVSPAETLASLERLARLIRQAAHAEGLIPVQWEALRYVARANRLSNSPGALARYIGATKGTVSQTIGRLVKRGLLAKSERPADVRSIALTLTEQARALLMKDPLLAVAGDVDELGGKTHRRLSRGLNLLLAREALRQNQPLFGTCGDCRYLREGNAGAGPVCMKDNAGLSADEMARLCIEHTPRN
ncbi:MAG: MarR family transcriptional regulator [Proteobacteria bacterium]|nr:MarR family transcriptional regulator [Pseudomonadota bacterium]